ncbi:MAG: pyridoxamine 5'-phosphate oxidase family protein [Pseudomonadota bacterium]
MSTSVTASAEAPALPVPAEMPPADSPFHEGEIAIQARYGVVERIGPMAARYVRDHLTAQHRDFFEQLPSIVLGSVDGQGRPWASMLAGAPGFLSAPDERHLHIAAEPRPGDPLAAALAPGAMIGGLGIAFESRRRNRFAARVEAAGADGVTLAIDQSFGNCPQYILTRAPVAESAGPGALPAPERLEALDAEAEAMIRAADTFFIASAAPADGDMRHGADVSHRGGKPGFVRVGPDGVLTVPDFAGNLHFNTLGNLLLDPRAGLLFVDFATGDLLQMTGTTEIVFDGPEIAAFQGAERLLRFRMTEGVRLRGALGLRFAGGEPSPNSLITGDWAEAEARLAAEAERDAWRRWRIAGAKAESETVRSLMLEPVDGGAVPLFRAGQHLPVRFEVPGHGVIRRQYTVSSAPEDRTLRLSVKRDGLASRHLHALPEGAIIEAQAPRGGFTIDAAERRPAVLLSAGIGITPMISMLRHLLAEGVRTRHTRPVWFLHSARSMAERAFADELARLAQVSDRVRAVQLLSRPEAEAVHGEDYNLAGRLDVAVLKRVLPFDDHDFYLCGPEGFVQGLYDGLRDMGVRDARIFAEAFGPSSLTRRPDGSAPAAAAEAEAPTEVVFAKSGKTATWQPGGGSLLELAESAGLAPEFGCRSGSCGTCAVKAEGALAYRGSPNAPTGAGEALICCAVPAAREDEGRVVLDL